MSLKITWWNACQLANRVLGQPPIDCHYPTNKGFCEGCEPGEYFKCSICKRLRAYCFGHDNDFDLCDDCWSDKYREDPDKLEQLNDN